MIINNALGIIFANAHDELVSDMTEVRAMAAIPFAGRYRVIDFTLSNLVNSGISKVGIITKINYQSLVEHIGTGKPWDLDRKNEGVVILSPFRTSSAQVFKGHVDALYGVIDFLKKSKEQYVVLSDADVITNFSISNMMSQHKSTGAQITIAYKKGKLPKNQNDIMSFNIDNKKHIREILLSKAIDGDCNFSLDVIILEREFLIKLIEDAHNRNYTSFSKDVLQSRLNELDIYGYEVVEYAAVLDSDKGYVKATNDLLNDLVVRKQLFEKERPIYTRSRNDMPTKYGLNSHAVCSMIADGCQIEGTVVNSVIFRGVKVKKGAHVENCIIMQGCEIGEGAKMKYVTLDRKVVVKDGTTLNGAPNYYVYIKKGSTV